jgi:carbonic anhydrase/acetyltransferase-like protein (isoleucine patch superfamily)
MWEMQMNGAKDNDVIAIDDSAWVHESAFLFGHIAIGADSSVWPYVVMRSEMFHIEIGARTNIQDFVMIHVGGATPTIIGDDCSITHHATIHGCTIGDRCLIGINATIMDGAKIGNNCIVAGHAIVTEGSAFPDNSIIAGSPAKLVKTRDSGAANTMNAAFYVQNAKNYARGIHRISEDQLRAAGFLPEE